MKGLYQLKADHDITDRAIAAGIDTLLIPFYTFPGRPFDGLMDTWEQNIATCNLFKGRARIIAVPIAMATWCEVPEGRRFVYQGEALAKTFCPTNAEHLESLIAPFRGLINDGTIHEVVWDNEQYPEYTRGGATTNEPKYFSKKIPCECPSCQPLGWDSQWKHRAMLMSKDTFSTGQLAIDSWWSVNCLNQKRVFPEGTYEDTSSMKRFLMRLQLWSIRFLAKKHGCNMTMIPGAWIEVFKSTDDYIKYLGYLSKHYTKDGYWIYSQMALTRNITLPQNEIDQNIKGYGYYSPQRIDERDPQFFDKLRKFNG
jgi:hypothetical protein